MTLPLFVGLTLAIWRITRLLLLDTFPPVKAIREWFLSVFARSDEQGNIIGGKRWGMLGYSLAYVWTCAWCMSVWVGLGVWALADWRLSVPYPWLIVAAGSLISGLASQVEAAHEQRYALRQQELDER